MSTETRLEEVERRLERMASRLRRLEVERDADEPPALWGQVERPRAYTPPAAPPRREQASYWPSPEPQGGASRKDFEEVFGGRVLAWVGGLAILFGAILFMAMTISRGWLGEEARTVIATLGSLGLLGVGVWLHERKGKAEAARSAAAAAISSLYAILVVATHAYELLPPGIGLALAALVAAIGFAIAVRWSASVVAAVGSLGALASPVLILGEVPIAFVAVALAATVGILIWQRWNWLALGAFLVSAPQVLAWAIDPGAGHLVLPLLALVGFWALYAAAAFGYELRSREFDDLPIASWLLLFGGTAVAVGGGCHLLNGSEHGVVLWLFGFAAVQLLLGGVAMRFGIHREIGSLLVGGGIALSAFGLAEALSGPSLVVGWAAGSAALACLATRLDASPDAAGSSAERLLLAAGAFLLLAVGHVLLHEAPPSAIVTGVDDLGSALAAIAACAAAALACWHFARRINPVGAAAVGFLGAGCLVYLGSVLIVDTIGVGSDGESRQAGQVWLSVFWTVTGLGAVVWGLVGRTANVRLGGLALLGIAVAKVWTYDLSELDQLARVLSFIGLGLLLLLGAFAYQRIKPGREGEERKPQASL